MVDESTFRIHPGMKSMESILPLHQHDEQSVQYFCLPMREYCTSMVNITQLLVQKDYELRLYPAVGFIPLACATLQFVSEVKPGSPANGAELSPRI